MIVLIALVIATFLMVQLVPGDPARVMAGVQADPAAVEQVRHDLGLDRPLRSQFGSYVSGLVRLDMGTSFKTRQPVRQLISEQIGPTGQLVALGTLTIIIVGVPMGLIGGVFSRGRKWVEVAFSAGTGTIAAVPHYLTATFLAFLFAVTWRLFPVAGSNSWDAAVLPSIAIAVGPAAIVARVMRVRTLEVLEQPYVRTARSKRLGPWKLYVKHVLPNALTTVVGLAGVLFAGLIGGAIIVEQVFARRGLGTVLVRSILSGDYPVVQGVVLLLGVSVVVINALMDAVLAMIDPQTLERSS